MNVFVIYDRVNINKDQNSYLLSLENFNLKEINNYGLEYKLCQELSRLDYNIDLYILKENKDFSFEKNKKMLNEVNLNLKLELENNSNKNKKLLSINIKGEDPSYLVDIIISKLLKKLKNEKVILRKY